MLLQTALAILHGFRTIKGVAEGLLPAWSFGRVGGGREGGSGDVVLGVVSGCLIEGGGEGGMEEVAVGCAM